MNVDIVNMEKLKVPQNLYKQYLRGKYCDLQIQVENSFYRAHSCVVAAASWVLEAILQSSASGDESLSKLSIQLHDVSAYAIACLLGYIYTGKLPAEVYQDESKKKEVLHAANLYKMEDVVDELSASNSSENALGILENGSLSEESILANLVDAENDTDGITALNGDDTVELQEILIDSQIQESVSTLSLEDIKKHVSESTAYAREHGILYCVLCSEIFSTQPELINHMVDHKVRYRKQPERAAAASASFFVPDDDVLGDMTDDIDFSPQQVTSKKKATHKSFTCSECGAVFNGKAYLIKHYTSTHPGTIFCKLCVQCFDTDEDLQAHIITHKPQEFDTLNSDTKCKRGRKPRIGPKTFGCTVCSTSFEKRRELIKHRELIHGIMRPVHTCTTCGKQYKEKQSLRAHLRVHTGERPYVCSHCGNAFSDAKTWKDHERRHRGEKPFLCTTCGKSFTYRQSFTRHMKFHEGKRPFQCSFCGKAFVLRQNMKEHEKRHNK